MSRSLFNDLNGNRPPSNPLTNFAEFMGEFQKFSSSFKGDPETQVRQLLSSGKMSQEQFKQYASIADTIRGRKLT